MATWKFCRPLSFTPNYAREDSSRERHEGLLFIFTANPAQCKFLKCFVCQPMDRGREFLELITLSVAMSLLLGWFPLGNGKGDRIYAHFVADFKSDAPLFQSGNKRKGGAARCKSHSFKITTSQSIYSAARPHFPAGAKP